MAARLLTAATLIAVVAGLTTAAPLLQVPATDNGQYDPMEAMSALYYAKSSYCDPANIATWSCGACPYHPMFTDVGVYTNASLDSQAFTGYDPQRNQIVAAFRGTVTLDNWISDFIFFKVPYPNPACKGCMVHEGFLGEWFSFSARVMPALQLLKAKYPTANILVAGHSLGAAVASIAAVDIVNHISNNTHVYSFGTPRTGDEAWTQYARSVLPGRQFRVVHRCDPVPHLPFFDMGFIHNAHELWYDNNGNVTWKDCNDAAWYEDPTCSDSILPIIFSDHTLYLGQEVGCFMGSALESEKAASAELASRVNVALKKKGFPIGQKQPRRP